MIRIRSFDQTHDFTLRRTWLSAAGYSAGDEKEINTQFGMLFELRRVQIESVRWMVELDTQAGVERIILNGSFVTEILEPEDVDCALLFFPKKDKDRTAYQELKAGLPFLGMTIDEHDEFDDCIGDVFATDRDEIHKGMIEVIL